MERLAPSWHHRYIRDELIPELRKRDVTTAQIDLMTIENPRAFFAASALR